MNKIGKCQANGLTRVYVLDVADGLGAFSFPFNFLLVPQASSVATRASMFRSPASSPRSLVPPSSFPSGLQPNASRGDRNGNRVDSNMRQKPRIDMSFEQALEAGETMVIKEGIDFDSLGEDSAPALKYLSSSSPLSPPDSSSHPQSMPP